MAGAIPTVQVDAIAMEDCTNGGGVPLVRAWGADVVDGERLGDDSRGEPHEVVVGDPAHNGGLDRVQSPVAVVPVVFSSV